LALLLTITSHSPLQSIKSLYFIEFWCGFIIFSLVNTLHPTESAEKPDQPAAAALQEDGKTPAEKTLLQEAAEDTKPHGDSGEAHKQEDKEPKRESSGIDANVNGVAAEAKPSTDEVPVEAPQGTQTKEKAEVPLPSTGHKRQPSDASAASSEDPPAASALESVAERTEAWGPASSTRRWRRRRNSQRCRMPAKENPSSRRFRSLRSLQRPGQERARCR